MTYMYIGDTGRLYGFSLLAAVHNRCVIADYIIHELVNSRLIAACHALRTIKFLWLCSVIPQRLTLKCEIYTWQVYMYLIQLLTTTDELGKTIAFHATLLF